MTYDEIVAALYVRDLGSAARSLETAVRDEGCMLIDGGTAWGDYKSERHRRLRIPSAKAETAAKNFYAEEITGKLREYEPPSPDLMLSHRRFATAWAVAQILRTRKFPMKCCEKCGAVISKPRLDTDENERCSSCGD